MRHASIDPLLFVENRRRLRELMLPGSVAVVNNNDLLPTNADGSLILQPNSDLFYFTGIEQEESVLVFFPDAHDERNREILFLREPIAHLEIWEGKKLSKEEAIAISGIKRVEWLSAFDGIFRALMCECESVYLNSNEHARAVVVVETREARFVKECRQRYPLHQYHRLARLIHRLRAVKSEAEIGLIRKACEITRDGLVRVARFVKPGVSETHVEAEFAHEFIRQNGKFAYSPIIAGGANACGLHYNQNSAPCRDGDLLLLDVGAAYGNYNSDLTRTLPINGRFTKRQRQIYDAVLGAYKACADALKPGLLASDWRRISEEVMEKALVDVKLLKASEVRKQGPEKSALKKYYMHGIGHPIGLDVHDVAPLNEPMQAGAVVTCEPGIYIAKEGLAVRLENTLLVTEKGAINLMNDIPIEAAEIEELMNNSKAARRR
ncbi:MAG: pepP [Chthoniobacteraceae bacterium]|nr:pepP [Chthoniobacteraceae bacterium]